ncbi:hypothetical protein CLCR_11033 [Cladophialophora carrionii]|uniref:Uncharacterized protein n=1 Tax=Cladophialophora carrionii TaxID=86049 RepID=A0A1C1CYM2_9EURO|nr:hypothetical protein CLCR_11033 [Cladophialophora carrionii]
MAQTRGATGNSKPRVFATVSTEPTRKRKTPATSTTAGTKAKTTKSATGAGVTKKRAANTTHKRKPSVKDKVEGAVEKIEGTIEGKPAKKAAATKKMRGTDGKNNKTAKVKTVEA